MTANIYEDLPKTPNRKKHFRKYSRFNRFGKKSGDESQDFWADSDRSQESHGGGEARTQLAWAPAGAWERMAYLGV